MRESPNLNLAHSCVTEGVNGPGRRFTVWVQGCPLDCPGCFNPELRLPALRQRVSPGELAREARDAGPWDGVTLTGGEPFAQAEGLADFLGHLEGVAEGRGPSTVAFTGHRLEELRAGARAWRRLLAAVDLLVDGPFREDLARDLPLRGSSNQRVIPLSAEGRRLAGLLGEAGGFQTLIGAGGEVIVTGFPPAEALLRLRRAFGTGGTGPGPSSV